MTKNIVCLTLGLTVGSLVTNYLNQDDATEPPLVVQNDSVPELKDLRESADTALQTDSFELASYNSRLEPQISDETYREYAKYLHDLKRAQLGDLYKKNDPDNFGEIDEWRSRDYGLYVFPDK